VTGLIDPIATALLVVRHLDAMDILHTIGGSIASSFAGDPRSTVDVDIVVALEERHVEALVARRLRLGRWSHQPAHVGQARGQRGKNLETPDPTDQVLGGLTSEEGRALAGRRVHLPPYLLIASRGRKCGKRPCGRATVGAIGRLCAAKEAS
jgi:hypothetical protein